MNTHKVLVCASGIVLEHGSHCLRLVIPSWKDEVFLFPLGSIPQNILSSADRFPDNKLRFYAKVDLDASNPKELNMMDFEPLDLASLFRKK